MTIKKILEAIIFTIECSSTIVIALGVIYAFLSFIKVQFYKQDKKLSIDKITTIKNYLGTYILFGLEILIGADIIESILDPSTDHILILAAIVIIRTVISYFLNKEIESSEEKHR